MAEKIDLEYQELGSLFRQYTNFLLSITQHFIAGNGLLFIGLTYATRNLQSNTFTVFLITLLGLFGSLGTLIVQIRTFNYWKGLLKRGIEIEENFSGELYNGFYQISKKGKIRSANFSKVLYGTFSFLWFIILLKICGVSVITFNI